jgi:hypothetical protein
LEGPNRKLSAGMSDFASASKRSTSMIFGLGTFSGDGIAAPIPFDLGGTLKKSTMLGWSTEGFNLLRFAGDGVTTDLERLGI